MKYYVLSKISDGYIIDQTFIHASEVEAGSWLAYQDGTNWKMTEINFIEVDFPSTNELKNALEERNRLSLELKRIQGDQVNIHKKIESLRNPN